MSKWKYFLERIRKYGGKYTTELQVLSWRVWLGELNKLLVWALTQFCPLTYNNPQGMSLRSSSQRGRASCHHAPHSLNSSLLKLLNRSAVDPPQLSLTVVPYPITVACSWHTQNYDCSVLCNLQISLVPNKLSPLKKTHSYRTLGCGTCCCKVFLQSSPATQKLPLSEQIPTLNLLLTKATGFFRG